MAGAIRWIHDSLRIAAFFAEATLAGDLAWAAETVEPGEMELVGRWIKEHLLSPDPQLPFSFLYGGRSSAELLAAWERRAETKNIGGAERVTCRRLMAEGLTIAIAEGRARRYSPTKRAPKTPQPS